MQQVLLEVGHGPTPRGFDPGSQAHGLREYDLNWVLANSARDALLDLGISAKITDATASLYKIGKSADGFPVFVSCHHNAFNGLAQGTEVLVHDTKADPKDFELAEMISSEISAELGIRNRGVKKKSLAVLSGAEDAEGDHYAGSHASVLVEPYFLDALRSGHELWSERSGRALARAIARFLS